MLIYIFLIILLPFVTSIPPIPTEFYGTATRYDVNSTPLQAGTVINIFAGNVSCGSFIIQNAGYYGVLTCLGDDNYTSIVEGAEQGQNIVFYLENETAQTFGDTVWYYGEYHMVNITPMPRCGNGICELTESCITCVEDCGRCATNGTGTGTGTGSGGGNTTGGGSSSGGGDSSGGGGTTIGLGGGSGDQDITASFCQEDWICSEWYPEICPVEETQWRDCNDKNDCGTDYLKPTLNQTCVYQGTCIDTIKNQDETDRDCGGLKCNPCDLGKKCLFDYDCKSGFCDPLEYICKEPTCNDNFKNQGEEGIDCGGPCPPCERPSIEKPGTIARFLVTGCGPFPWLFLLVATLIAFLIYIIGKAYIQKIKNSKDYKELKKIEQLRKIYDLNRDLHVFLFITLLLEIAVSLFLYYLCEIAIWIFFMVLIILPIIGAIIIKAYVYDEKRKKETLRKTILKHEDFLMKLIKIEREEVKKEERKVFEKLTNEIDYFKLDKKLALLLKDIRFSIEEMINSKEEEPIETENNLINTITEIDTYKGILNNNEFLTNVYSDLKFIEKIHRDILLQYKKLREDKELEKELNEEEKEKIKIETKAENEKEVDYKNNNYKEKTEKPPELMNK